MASGYTKLTKSQNRIIERALVMDQGYVLDFSNRTIEMFFEDYFRINFYSDSYSFNGESKAKRLRAIFTTESDSTVAGMLRKLWDYRTTLSDYYKLPDPDEEKRLKSEFFSCVDLIAGLNNAPVVLSALERFDESDTLDNLIYSIERDVREDRYQAALDRLHTYCQRRFRKLLESSGRQVSEEDSLHSRVGAYVKILEAEGVSQISITILKYSISVFEKFNGVRNDQSLAHDNELLDHREARLVLDAVGAVLRFLKSLRGDAF